MTTRHDREDAKKTDWVPPTLRPQTPESDAICAPQENKRSQCAAAYSIISLARANNVAGTVRPIVLAVFKLTTR